MKNKNKKVLVIALCTIIGVGVILYLATNIIPRSLVSVVTRASSFDKLSLKDSYLIGQKILAKANGKDQVVVNVFLIDSQGKGISKKNVMLSGMDNSAELIGSTDESGKATFKVTSQKEGQYSLSATVDGAQLPKKLMVTFRND
jgi:hypothetical protein